MDEDQILEAGFRSGWIAARLEVAERFRAMEPNCPYSHKGCGHMACEFASQVVKADDSDRCKQALAEFKKDPS